MFSEYSHASLVVRMDEFCGDDNRICIIEAVWPHLEPSRLSSMLGGKHGEAFLYKTTLPHEKRELMRIFALCKLFEHVRYDVQGVVFNLFGRVSLNAARYYCSEFVIDCYRNAGVVQTDIAIRPGEIPDYINGTLIGLEK